MKLLPLTLSALAVLPEVPRLAPPARPAPHLGLSVALLKATALELVVLAGHLLLYPSGITDERHPAPPAVPAKGDPEPGTPPRPETTADGTTEPATESATETAENDRRPTRLPRTPAQQRPVVLLHGFVDNRSVFVLLRRALAKDGGRHVEALNYSPFAGDIRATAADLGRRIAEICARTGHDEVDLVGHSLGGLIARYYAQRLGGDRRIRTLVTLGTPHGGTPVAPLMDAHPVVRQMRPESDLIAELKEPAPGCRTRFVSFWSELDPLMNPLETARVDHPDLRAHDIRVTGIGHLALPVHPAVATAVREAIDADGPMTAATTDQEAASVA
ncbi:esterase/lipase family protein [Streptomyces sp. NPDC002851]